MRLFCHVPDCHFADIDDFVVDIGSDQHVLDAMFASEEQEECDGNAQRLASRLALKEAALKVLGTGIRQLDVLDITIATAANGRPSLHLSERAAKHAAAAGLNGFRCSTSRDAGLAIGVVIATTTPSSSTNTANGSESLQEAS